MVRDKNQSKEEEMRRQNVVVAWCVLAAELDGVL